MMLTIIVSIDKCQKRKLKGSQLYQAIKLHRIGFVTLPIKMMDPVK